jgi:GMP synthase-like glutamine amidotransferase
MNRVDVFQHMPTEPLGYIDNLFSLLNVPFKHHCLWETNEVSARDATRLIFLGGPMSVNNEVEFPWLRQEKDLIRRALKKEIPALGLCLGAQLVASANGARVFRFAHETGWCRVHREPGVKGPFATFPDSLYVFQMHNETFEIPYSGNLLFTGERVRNQGFRLKAALLPPVPS